MLHWNFTVSFSPFRWSVSRIPCCLPHFFAFSKKSIRTRSSCNSNSDKFQCAKHNQIVIWLIISRRECHVYLKSTQHIRSSYTRRLTTLLPRIKIDNKIIEIIIYYWCFRRSGKQKLQSCFFIYFFSYPFGGILLLLTRFTLAIRFSSPTVFFICWHFPSM